MSDSHVEENDVVHVPIDGTLDLHNFLPRDLKHLIPDYLEECCKAEITQVRIIHGKGIGNIRRTVHAILERLPEVIEFKLAGEDAGGWGATLVKLKKK
ncbi:Smr/MutS family protein [Thermodesulfobacteriota bacterium]